MTTSETYVTAAFLVFLAAVLLYVVIYAFKISRLSREVAELAELAGRGERPEPAARERDEPKSEHAPAAG